MAPTQKSDPSPVAWLTGPSGTLWYASGEGPVIARLVTGIYEAQGFEAWRTLRQRIHFSGEVGSFEAALVRVCAKRISAQASLADFFAAERLAQQVTDLSQTSLSDPVAAREVSHLKPIAMGEDGPLELLRANRDFAATIPLDPDLFASPRPVAATLVSDEGAWLAAAVNSNGIVRTRHAEFNLVFNWMAATGRKIPAGAVLGTSLSPCRMCAALLAAMSEDGPELLVWSERADPGRLGRQHSLNRVQIFASESVSDKAHGTTT